MTRSLLVRYRFLFGVLIGSGAGLASLATGCSGGPQGDPHQIGGGDAGCDGGEVDAMEVDAAEVDACVEEEFFLDSDGDEEGDSTFSTMACDEPPGFVDNDTDCDDSNQYINTALDTCTAPTDPCLDPHYHTVCAPDAWWENPDLAYPIDPQTVVPTCSGTESGCGPTYPSPGIPVRDLAWRGTGINDPAVLAQAKLHCPHLVAPQPATSFDEARGRRWQANPNGQLRDVVTNAVLGNQNRRASFLYANDGCWSRADAMAYRINQQLGHTLGKIWIFGNLLIDSANTTSLPLPFNPMYKINWGWHVAICYLKEAPAVATINDVMIIDPSLFPDNAVTAPAWVASMNDGMAAVAFSTAGTYFPGNAHDAAVPNAAAWAARFAGDQVTYLTREWQGIPRYPRMGNPAKECGNGPFGFANPPLIE